jgi:UrcA family protein
MTRNRNLKAAICSALCAMSLASLSLPAGASDANDVPRRVVKFDDLDLTRSAGVAALYARIQHAAREVCPALVSRDLGAAMRARACAARAVKSAIADVNVPQLTGYYLAKQGRTPIIVAQRH